VDASRDGKIKFKFLVHIMKKSLETEEENYPVDSITKKLYKIVFMNKISVFFVSNVKLGMMSFLCIFKSKPKGKILSIKLIFQTYIRKVS
jgi:hypothetical protein